MVACVLGGQPMHPRPETAGPVTIDRRRPLAGFVITPMRIVICRRACAYPPFARGFWRLRGSTIACSPSGPETLTQNLFFKNLLGEGTNALRTKTGPSFASKLLTSAKKRAQVAFVDGNSL